METPRLERCVVNYISGLDKPKDPYSATYVLAASKGPPAKMVLFRRSNEDCGICLQTLSGEMSDPGRNDR